jgi:hypothetical protein
MSPILCTRGRTVTPDDLETLRALLEAHPETFVDPERCAGTGYRAANGQELGLTTGCGKDDLKPRPNRSRKQVLGTPLRADFHRGLGVLA